MRSSLRSVYTLIGYAVDLKRTLSETGEARKQLPARPAVITVMGHVDHGKTSLLDALRGTNTAAHEAGGITQSVSAFKGSGDRLSVCCGPFEALIVTRSPPLCAVPFDKQVLTFLDTPGHGAFHIMRETGSGVADIVLLVVAIDEGVKPQTKESVGMAVRAKTPILAAINKIDLGGDPAKLRTRIKRLVPAPLLLGTVEVSAKRRQNLDVLRDAILRASTEVDPRAPTAVPVEGTVIEAVVDRSKGHIIRGVVHRGTLSAGQHLVAGLESGRVRALFSDSGAPIKEARAGEPVQIAGLGGTPLPGEAFFVNTKERIEEVVEYRKLQLRYQEQQEWAESQPQLAAPVPAVGAQYSVGRRREERKAAMKKRRQAGLGARPVAKPKAQASEEEEEEEEAAEEEGDDEGLGVRVPLVVKAGNVGSLVMLLNSLHELSDPDVNVAVVHASVGEVKPRDIVRCGSIAHCWRGRIYVANTAANGRTDARRG